MQELTLLTELVCDGDKSEAKEMLTLLFSEIIRFETQHSQEDGGNEASSISHNMHKLAGASALMYLNQFSSRAEEFEVLLQSMGDEPVNDYQLIYAELRQILHEYLLTFDE